MNLQWVNEPPINSPDIDDGTGPGKFEKTTPETTPETTPASP